MVDEGEKLLREMDVMELPTLSIVTTSFMKVFAMPDAIALVTRETDWHDKPSYSIRVRFAYKDSDIKVSSVYETETQQCTAFTEFTHASAVQMLEELKLYSLIL